MSKLTCNGRRKVFIVVALIGVIFSGLVRYDVYAASSDGQSHSAKGALMNSENREDTKSKMTGAFTPFILKSALDKYPFLPGISVQIFSSKGNSFSWTIIEKGVNSPRQTHQMEQTSVLIEGKLEATVGEETKTIVSGDAVLIPSGVLHEFRAVEKSLLLEIFEPRIPQSAIDGIKTTGDKSQ